MNGSIGDITNQYDAFGWKQTFPIMMRDGIYIGWWISYGWYTLMSANSLLNSRLREGRALTRTLFIVPSQSPSTTSMFLN